jgi:MFS family permease
LPCVAGFFATVVLIDGWRIPNFFLSHSCEQFMSSKFHAKWQGLGRAFSFLLLCDLLTVLSFSTGNVAISWWIVTKGGASDLSLFGVTSALVMLIALPLLSAVGDKHAKSRLMAFGLLSSVASGVGLAVMASLGIYRIEWLILVTMIELIAFAAVLPAMSNIAADLVPTERLADALSLQKTCQSIGNLAGPVLGGAVVALNSISLGLWIYVFMLCVAVLAAFSIPTAPVAVSGEKSSWAHQVKAGLVAKWKIPIERGWSLFSFLSNVCFTPVLGMLLPLKIHALNLDASWLGATEAAFGLGMLIGSFWGASSLIASLGRFRAIMCAIVIESLAMILVAVSYLGWLLVVGFGMAGFFLAITQLVGQTHRMLAVPDDFRVRFSSVNIMLFQVSSMVGPAIAGVALGTSDVTIVYFCFATALLLIALGYPMVPEVRKFLSLDHTSVKGWYRTNHPEAFDSDVGGAGILVKT